jgi:hypothetical protein
MDADGDVDTVGMIDCSRDTSIATPTPNADAESCPAGACLAERQGGGDKLLSPHDTHASSQQQDRAGVDDFRTRHGHPEADTAPICRPPRAVD